MSIPKFDPRTGTYQDHTGNIFTTPGPPSPTPPPSGSLATRINNGQRTDGRIIGGVFVPNE